MCRQTRHNKSNPIPHQPHQHPTSSTLLPCHQLHPGELDTTSSSLTPQTPLWPATSRRHHQHSHTTTVPVVNTTTTESIMEGGRLLPILGCSRPRVHLVALRRSNSPRHGCSTAGTDPSTHKSDVAPPSVPPPPNPPRAPSPPLVATTAAPGKTPSSSHPPGRRPSPSSAWARQPWLRRTDRAPPRPPSVESPGELLPSTPPSACPHLRAAHISRPPPRPSSGAPRHTRAPRPERRRVGFPLSPTAPTPVSSPERRVFASDHRASARRRSPPPTFFFFSEHDLLDLRTTPGDTPGKTPCLYCLNSCSISCMF
ncbi:uncharacterized protein M6B38_117230 [Iris pallida]|uniref:Uncharacterized protein n=1 Tax=Iris pallida TaxID=29817 RepID=A0AAX6HTV0_IRIPA|nr:uncharacterized protein M6B38_117230 [Iris pallida]